MTTIAWDGHTIAVDSQSTGDESVMFYRNKIAWIGETVLVGAGRFSDINHLANCLRNKTEIPAGLDIVAYHIGKDFIHKYTDSKYPESVPLNEPFAQGSGWAWAQSALDFGKNAVEAVEYACTRDIFTGGAVNFVEIIPRQ